MPKKGFTNNPNGRKKGVPNKSTNELRGLLQCFIEQHIETLESDFKSLEPYQRLTVLERFLKLVLPPMINDLSQLSESDLDLLIEKLKREHNEKQKD
jgi:hypothetical protein